MVRQPIKDGVCVSIYSGVSAFTGEAFCTVAVNEEPIGQLMPDEVRTMALKWLAAAEAAEMDAMVMSELTAGLGMEFQMAGQFLTHLRKRRGDSNT